MQECAKGEFMSFLRNIVLGLLFIFLSFNASALKNISKEEAVKRLKLFEYEKGIIKNDIESYEEFKKYTKTIGKITVKSPTSKKSLMNVQYHYLRTSREKAPLIVIFPPIGGLTILDKDMSKYFAKNGFNVLIAILSEDISDLSRPIEDVDGFFIRSTIGVRHLLDTFLEKPENDSQNVFAFGVSLGGIRATLAMGVEGRFKAGSMMVAGGNLPKILSHSTEKRIRPWRKLKMLELGIDSKKEFEKILEETFKIDPIYFARFRKPSEFKFVIGRGDRIVPTKTQFELWKSLGKPMVEKWAPWHYVTAGTYRIQRKRFLKFFNSFIFE